MVADYQLVEFFAKSCSHCRDMAPVWASAKHTGEAAFPNVEFQAKQCYADNWMPGKDVAFCQEKNIGAFPTLVLYKNNGEHWTAPPLGGNSVEARADELLKFVQSHVENGSVSQQSVPLQTLIATVVLRHGGVHDFL